MLTRLEKPYASDSVTRLHPSTAPALAQSNLALEYWCAPIDTERGAQLIAKHLSQRSASAKVLEQLGRNLQNVMMSSAAQARSGGTNWGAAWYSKQPHVQPVANRTGPQEGTLNASP